jgi:hypothetical protein
MQVNFAYKGNDEERITTWMVMVDHVPFGFVRGCVRKLREYLPTAFTKNQYGKTPDVIVANEIQIVDVQ